MQVDEAVQHRARRKSSSADGNYKQFLPQSSDCIHCGNAAQDLNALNLNANIEVCHASQLEWKHIHGSLLKTLYTMCFLWQCTTVICEQLRLCKLQDPPT